MGEICCCSSVLASTRSMHSTMIYGDAVSLTEIHSDGGSNESILETFKKQECAERCRVATANATASKPEIYEEKCPHSPITSMPHFGKTPTCPNLDLICGSGWGGRLFRRVEKIGKDFGMGFST